MRGGMMRARMHLIRISRGASTVGGFPPVQGSLAAHVVRGFAATPRSIGGETRGVGDVHAMGHVRCGCQKGQGWDEKGRVVRNRIQMEK